uniref:Ribbon-helix-helix protein CopG domain-containing protein n=1 Tax=Candidatus Methanophagaceae archaeon ANME-1 ERB6 TaxID=2759912 RepID=A0A7G9YZF5_9EURY|nr:hypothetical protein OJFPBHNK_00015 [Methanosarcinales archaeon ANME-1 ERB6]
MKRTIKVSETAYQALSHQSEKEGKTKEEIASSIISAALGAELSNSRGEQYYPKTDQRIFRR